MDERLRSAQERDEREMRLIEQMAAEGVNPELACAQVIGGEFCLSGIVLEVLSSS